MNKPYRFTIMEKYPALRDKEKVVQLLKTNKYEDAAKKLGVTITVLHNFVNNYITKGEKLAISQAKKAVLQSKLRFALTKHEIRKDRVQEDGGILRAVRQSCSMSVAELARKSKVKAQTVSDIELGRRTPSSENLDKILSVLSEHVEKAYIAGLFDRKSSFGILKVNPTSKKKFKETHQGWTNGPGYLARIEFRTRHKVLVDLLLKVFGCGSLSVYGHKDSNIPVGYIYMAWSKNAEKVCETLLPYAKVKRPQIELLLQLRQFQNMHRAGGTKLVCEEYYKLAENLKNQIHELNKR